MSSTLTGAILILVSFVLLVWAVIDAFDPNSSAPASAAKYIGCYVLVAVGLVVWMKHPW